MLVASRNPPVHGGKSGELPASHVLFAGATNKTCDFPPAIPYGDGCPSMRN